VSVAALEDIVATVMWPQGDARDPLGLWFGEVRATGDASAGHIRFIFRVQAARRAQYVFAAYNVSLQIPAGLAATTATWLMLRTNWPNIASATGQAFTPYEHLRLGTTPEIGSVAGDADFQESPFGINGQLLHPNDRFLLLSDPRRGGTAMEILELQVGTNENTVLYIASAWGYFWDRAVYQAPGGPRHPGSG